MAEVLAGVSTWVMKSLLSKLAKLLGDEYNLLQEVRGEVEFLHRELTSLDSLLRKLAALEKLGRDTKELRIALKEMVYDIEDGIDVFMNCLGSARDKDGFMHDVAKQLNLKVRHQIAKQIQELKARVVEESERNMRHQLHGSTDVSMDNPYVSDPTNQEIDPRVKALYADPEHQLVGMDGPVEKIVELLTLEEDDSAQQLQVVSILGPGGLGKTTCANQVYRKIKDQFDFTALISVSQRPNILEILRKMVKTGSNLDKWQLIAGAQDYLREKRYLIVFDDIWSIETWEQLKSILPQNNNKSRVITTTRITDVASSCCSKTNDHIHILDPLNNDCSKELFFRRIFSPKRTCPDALDEVANKILKKCGGIPLAIITIAGLLSKKPKTKKEWKRVQSSIGNACELRGMRKTLSLSFHDLSYDLRACFISLSIFPEDYEIDRQRLVSRWIAEGFVSGKEELDSEQIGQNYFNELINRSLIQPIDIEYNGLARACRIHDLMLELIVALSKEENFVTILGGLERPSVPNTIRRISIQSNEDAVLQVIKDKNMSHVRSLSFFTPKAELPNLSHFHALRVLDMKGFHFEEHQALKALASSIQLKYLNLSDTNVTELPKQIGDVHNLETLDLRGSPIQRLPSTFCQLQKLLRLFVSPGVALPDKIGKMLTLEEIEHVAILCNSLKFVEKFGDLTRLRALRVDCRYSWLAGKKQVPRNVDIKKYEETLLSSLCKLGSNNLQSLEIDIADDSLIFSLFDLCCALPQLEELTISNFLSRVPRLHLARTTDERLVISTGGFQCLKQFEFCCEDGGMGLKFAPGAMPDLEKLDLDIGVRTTMSKHGGFDFGIKNLEALKHVSVKLDCRFAEGREIQAAETAIISGVLPRRLMPQIQRIGR
ncbi:unnamed protein product [Urochloa humidicola]